MTNSYKKMLIKTGIFTVVILLIAIVCTYKIYHTFEAQRDKIRNSPSLAVTYHGKEKVSITRLTPVTDSVGLSSNPYRITIKNNSAKKVKYKLVIKEDTNKYEKDKCKDNKIPNNIIKVGIHTKGQVSDIYNLDDLEDNVLATKVISPKQEIDYTIRFWISQNTLTQDPIMHFHGILEVVEL